MSAIHCNSLPGAFAKMIAAGKRAELRMYSHDDDARTLARSVTLFEDSFGLGFEARIATDYAVRRAICQGVHTLPMPKGPQGVRPG